MTDDKSSNLIDMYNMIGYCSTKVLQEQTSFALRNLADGSDSELVNMQNELLAFVSNDILQLNLTQGSGLVLHSGSEANETAVALAQKISGRNIVLTSILCHSSVDNACQKLGLQQIKLSIDKDNLKVDPVVLKDALKVHGANIALLNVTCGVTKLGTAEDMTFIPEIEQIILQNNLRVHVDAAYGGFVLGLSEPSALSWLKSNGLKTVTVDPHKFVGALGCGLLLFVDHEDKFGVGEEVVYFPGNASALGTTRSAYPLATALAMIREKQFDGLRLIAIRCRTLAKEAEDRLRKHGIQLIVPAVSGVIPVKLKSNEDVDRVIATMHARGFKMSPIKILTNDLDIYGVRMVVTPRVETNSTNIDECLTALIDICVDNK